MTIGQPVIVRPGLYISFAAQITIPDLEWLVMSQKDLAKMEALKQAGLVAVRIDAFRQSLLNLVIDTILSKVPV